MNKNTCHDCRYWSDKIAQSIGCGPIEALCLGDGPKKGTYVVGNDSCPKWEDGPLGAIDSGSDEDPRYGNPYK